MTLEKKDFWIPCSFDQRRTFLLDQLLFIPSHFSLSKEVQKELFPFYLYLQGAPIYLELCSGNGEWVVAQALTSPQKNWIAVEKKFDRARKIWLKAKKQGCKNLLVVWGEAYAFLKEYLPKSQIEQLYINFPDPWPKNKHAKHRLLQLKFCEEVQRILCPCGKMILVTDDIPYRNQTISLFKKKEGFQPLFPNPYYITEWEDFGSSFFDTLWRQKNRSIFYIGFQKDAVC